ncbi:MAG: ATP synthase F1 subunit delta [Planctomycetota bacterium]|nr:MAG: ATP synthase F1 subunit delta [Planctomycetota bacterium]
MRRWPLEAGVTARLAGDSKHPMAEFIQADRTRDTVFDVDAERLARVYAQAGLAAAGDVAAQETVVTDLERIAEEALKRNPKFAEVLASGLISEEEKVGILDRVFGGRVAPTTLTLLKVMGRHGRLGLVRDVARAARGLWLTRAGRIPVELETAYPLDPALEQEVLRSFAHVLGADPIVTARVNPELIAGFVIRVGDSVYDGSVRTQLEHTRHAMINRAVEAIQRRPEQFFSMNSKA